MSPLSLTGVGLRIEDLEAIQEVRRKAKAGQARALRLAAGLTLGNIGDVCEVSGTTVARWENAERTPRGRAALRYARVLACLEERQRELSRGA